MGVKFTGGPDVFPWGQFKGWLLPDITAARPDYFLWVLSLPDLHIDIRAMVEEEVNTVRFELALAGHRKRLAIQRNAKRGKKKHRGTP